MAKSDRRAYQLGWELRRRVGGLFDAPADPTQSAFALRKEQAGRGTLLRGVVAAAVPYLHAYLVVFEYLAPPLVCTLGTQASALPIGVRQTTTLLPGSAVWVAWTPQMTYGVIQSVEPPAAVDPAAARSDWIHMASRCGLHVDKGYEALLRARNHAGLQNWASGRPVDSVPVGDVGCMSDTGLRSTVDPFMVQCAVDEATGLFAFYHDQAVRLAGVNLEVFSAGHYDQWQNDQGEVRIYKGWTPYPWEQLGALAPDVDPSRVLGAGASTTTEPHYASMEPREDDQLPFHRRVFLGGYVGQGGKDLVQAPPKAGGLLRRSAGDDAESAPTGLLEEQRTLAGAYMLRSVKAVHFCKHPTIPAPVQVARPEDLTGDDASNYRFSGLAGSGPEHKVAPRIEATEEHPGLQRLAGLDDELAYVRNWEGEHALAYHEKDWRLAEEGETPLAADYEPPPLDALVDAPAMPPPKTSKVKIDERYGEVEFYLNQASFTLFDDGAIVFKDGFGGVLQMAYGNVEISCPGDFVVRTGRSVINWAGRDVIHKAHDAVDVSAAKGDVRIKAERNLHALAGNGGEGGLLLESKGADAYDYADKVGSDVVSGGIQLKASAGSIVGWGSKIYLRTLDSGPITLDAGKGAGRITQVADTVESYHATARLDYFGPPGAVTGVNRFSASEAVLAADLTTVGRTTVAGGLLVRGGVDCVEGGFTSDQAEDSGGVVQGYGRDKTTPANFKKSIQSAARRAKSDAADGSKNYTGPLADAYYKPGGPGDDDVIDAARFSFRSTEQYRTEAYDCWESPWQQIARESGLKLAVWTEPPVEAAAQKTMPYPGEARTVTDPAFKRQTLKFFDWTTGAARGRADNRADYEAPKYEPVEPVVLDGAYMIMDSAEDESEGGETPTPESE